MTVILRYLTFFDMKCQKSYLTRQGTTLRLGKMTTTRPDFFSSQNELKFTQNYRKIRKKFTSGGINLFLDADNFLCFSLPTPVPPSKKLIAHCYTYLLSS